jgi:hypothetical protein
MWTEHGHVAKATQENGQEGRDNDSDWVLVVKPKPLRADVGHGCEMKVAEKISERSEGSSGG